MAFDEIGYEQEQIMAARLRETERLNREIALGRLQAQAEKLEARIAGLEEKLRCRTLDIEWLEDQVRQLAERLMSAERGG